MNNTENLCRIPGSGESGDPCSGNPFPPDDARYQVWADATRQAEREFSLLKIELLNLPYFSTEQIMEYLVMLDLGRFNIWAKRGVHVVWGDFNIAPYDTWLVRYAEATLKLAWEHGNRSNVNRELLLVELRRLLMQRVEYWKAEARRYVSQQPPEMHRGDQPDPEVEDASLATNGATERSADESTRTEAEAVPAVNGTDGQGADRRAAVEAYIKEVLTTTGKVLTRTHIWKKAGDKTRAEFERWESRWYEKHGRKPNRAANARFTRILTEKPHLK
jgi:hypothetical protein